MTIDLDEPRRSFLAIMAIFDQKITENFFCPPKNLNQNYSNYMKIPLLLAISPIFTKCENVGNMAEK